MHNLQLSHRELRHLLRCIDLHVVQLRLLARISDSVHSLLSYSELCNVYRSIKCLSDVLSLIHI